MKKIYTAIKIIVLLQFGALLLSGCTSSEAPKAQNNSQAVPVRAQAAFVRDISRAIDYVGDIKAQNEAVAYPKAGGKVAEKLKDEGDFVAKSEPIVLIDRDEVGLKFEKMPIESPLDGVVGRVYVDIGENVGPETQIALVVDDKNVKLSLDLPEIYLPEVSIGQKAQVSVDAYPDERFAGAITKISPVIDVTTRTAPVEITIENKDSRLKSGMFAGVNLVIEEHKAALVVLKEAIIGKEPDACLYIVADGKAIFKKVSLGIRQGPYVQITGGIKEGDAVVIMGKERLKDGALVSPEME